jgi:hypothetical protein
MWRLTWQFNCLCGKDDSPLYIGVQRLKLGFHVGHFLPSSPKSAYPLLFFSKIIFHFLLLLLNRFRANMSAQSSKSQTRPWVQDHSIGSVGSSLRRRSNRECWCGEQAVIRTVADISNPNCGKKFWGCKNYKNSFDKGCRFFKLLDEDVIDERDVKIEKQKKKIKKLKMELENTRKLLRMSMFFGLMCFGMLLVLGTVLMCKSTSMWNGFYLK